MGCLVKGPKRVHKKHLNETKSRNTDEENDTLIDAELMEVPFDTFDVPIPQKTLETKIQKRQIKRKRTETERIEINSKRKIYGLCAE